MTTGNIWVKRGSGISAFGLPLIVMAASKAGQQHWYGEYFVLLGGRHAAYLPYATSIKATDVPEDIATINADYMKVELDQHSSSRLSVHCFDLYEKTSREGFLKNIEFVDGEKLDILRAWLRGEYAEAIGAMHQTTKIDALRTFLQDVVRLTPVVQK